MKRRTEYVCRVSAPAQLVCMAVTPSGIAPRAGRSWVLLAGIARASRGAAARVARRRPCREAGRRRGDGVLMGSRRHRGQEFADIARQQAWREQVAENGLRRGPRLGGLESWRGRTCRRKRSNNPTRRGNRTDHRAGLPLQSACFCRTNGREERQENASPCKGFHSAPAIQLSERDECSSTRHALTIPCCEEQFMATGSISRSSLIGQRFGRLTVVAEAPRQSKEARFWLCRCDCGGEKIVRTWRLNSGYTKSCGCLAREVARALLTRHGMVETPEWRTWRQLRERCENKSDPTYGGRGITFCLGWRSFEAFYADMGPRPPAPKGSRLYSIDRIDNDGGYWCGHCFECVLNSRPANCRWATREQQGRNKRTNHLLTFNGKTQSIAAWAEETGIRWNIIKARIKYGWSVERALTEPPDPRKSRP